MGNARKKARKAQARKVQARTSGKVSTSTKGKPRPAKRVQGRTADTLPMYMRQQLPRIRMAVAAQTRANDEVRMAVTAARAKKVPWHVIGDMLGCSTETARKRYGG